MLTAVIVPANFVSPSSADQEITKLGSAESEIFVGTAAVVIVRMLGVTCSIVVVTVACRADSCFGLLSVCWSVRSVLPLLMNQIIVLPGQSLLKGVKEKRTTTSSILIIFVILTLTRFNTLPSRNKINSLVVCPWGCCLQSTRFAS